MNTPSSTLLEWVAIGLLIWGAKLWLIHNFGNPLPILDQWDGNLFLPWLEGNLTLAELFQPHNEHRIVFTRLLSLGLLILNDRQWDPLLEMVVNALIATFTALFLLVVLKRRLGQNHTLLITLLWILPYSAGNSLAGFHSCWYLLTLFTLLALWGLLLHRPFSWPWWLGVVSGWLAYFNIATGFFGWVAIIFISLVTRKIHLPTLGISSLMILLGLLLTLQVPTHPQFMAPNGWVFLQNFSQALAWPGILPMVNYNRLAVLAYLPWFALLYKSIHRSPSPGELFTLGLGAWVILQAASMAYARSGLPPSRYLDILALGTLANVLALNYLQPNLLARLWSGLLILGVVSYTAVMWRNFEQLQIDNHEQLTNVRHFLLSGESLQNKKIPYPSPERLAYLLSRLRILLPYRLKTPKLWLSKSANSPFINHHSPSYQNEPTLGNVVTGRFVSEFHQINKSFLEIPVTGYLGEPGLTLQLIVENQSTPISIVPPQLPKDTWVTCYVRTPKAPFQIIAIDNRPDAWFAFAMPRGIGILSFGVMHLLPQGKLLFILGIILYLSRVPLKK